MGYQYRIWNATAVCTACGEVEAFCEAIDERWVFEDGVHLTIRGIIDGLCPDCAPIRSFVGWIREALMPSTLRVESDNAPTIADEKCSDLHDPFDGGSDDDSDDDDSDDGDSDDE